MQEFESRTPDTDAAVPPLKESLGFAINVAGRYMKRMLDQRLNKYGLTSMQYVTLWSLWECNADIPLTQLSKRLCIDNPTMSGIVDRMVRDGFLERVQDTSDRRVTHVRLTQKSLELRDAIGGIGAEIDEETSRIIDRSLYTQVMDFLRRITRNEHEDK